VKLFAIICTRDKKLGEITSALVHTLSSYGVEVKLLVNQQSIFSAYKKGIDSCAAKEKDIIICCHDDLKLLATKSEFLSAIAKCVHEKTGIIGPAGTTLLGEDAVWWDHTRWQQGLHRGCVNHFNLQKENSHYESRKMDGTKEDGTGTVTPTNYGPPGRVVALDGLFLAARKEVWEKVGLEKPDYFEGDWDFYDIHYTTTAHKLGYHNHTVLLNMIHYSSGELVGRDSWHKNREAFIANTELPMRV
jgi:8-oxo-dGTP pyrophosphatase MutT (NUDIX family)